MGNQAGRQPTGRGGTSEHEVCASDRLLRSRTTPRMAPPSDRCGRPESRSIIPEATAASEVDVVAGGWHRFGTAQRLFGIDHPVMDVESLPQALPIGRRGDQPRQAVGATQGLGSGEIGKVRRRRSLPIPMFAIDDEHRVVFWNASCERITGIPGKFMLRKAGAWSAFYPSRRPVMADLVLTGCRHEDLERYYAGKYRPSALVEGGWECEDFFPQLPAGGKWLAFTAAPLRDGEAASSGPLKLSATSPHSAKRNGQRAMGQSSCRKSCRAARCRCS
jgi:hypothetical protein